MLAKTEPKLLEMRPVALHISTPEQSALGSLLFDVTRGVDPKTREVLYLGRVLDADTGSMLHELPYDSTDPEKMGRWWKRTTGQEPPEEIRGELRPGGAA